MLLTENASCHIPKHCTLNTYRNSGKEETYFVSEFILTQIMGLKGIGGGGGGVGVSTHGEVSTYIKNSILSNGDPRP